MTNIWKWPPAADEAYTERLAWYTSRAAPGDGSEELIRLRIHPRRYTEFTSVLADQADQIECDARIYEHGVGPWIMPYWWDACFPTIQLLINDEFKIRMDDIEATRDFQVGNYAVLKNGPGEMHAFEISDITPDNVLCDPHPPDGFLDQGRIVAYPASTAHMPAGVAVQRITSHLSTVAVVAEFIGYTSPEGERYPTRLDDMDVFELRPDWGDGIEQSYRYLIRRVDGKIGPYVLTDEGGQPFSDRSAPLKFLNDRSTLWDFRLWWQYLGGGATEFLSPTWVADLDVSSVEEAALEVRWGDDRLLWANKYQGLANRSRVYIRTLDGNHAKKITGSQGLEDDYEVLDITPTMSDQTADDIIQTSWLEKVRMASDELVISHIANGTASVNMEVRTIR